MKGKLEPTLPSLVKKKFKRAVAKFRDPDTAAHYEVAPPVMFIAGAGRDGKYIACECSHQCFLFLCPKCASQGAENAVFVTKMLSTRAFRIAELCDQNNPGLTQNVRLVREDYESDIRRPKWDNSTTIRK